MVAQWVNCWTADLAISGLISAGGKNLFYPKQGSLAHSMCKIVSPVSHHFVEFHKSDFNFGSFWRLKNSLYRIRPF